DLSQTATLIAAEKISLANGVQSISSQGQLGGLLDINGNSIWGVALPAEVKLQCARTLQGEPSWRYYKDVGLLVMVPVYQGTTARYVLCKLHTDTSLKDKSSPFHFAGKPDEDKILLYDTNTQRVVVPFENYKDSPFYDAATDSPLGLDKLLAKLASAHEQLSLTPSSAQIMCSMPPPSLIRVLSPSATGNGAP
ncbi:MAG: hypothetical protein IIT82_12060, partial [Selenomonas sp.]|nr:hypothetical protein [Selenomonas sp.]